MDLRLHDPAASQGNLQIDTEFALNFVTFPSPTKTSTKGKEIENSMFFCFTMMCVMTKYVENRHHIPKAVPGKRQCKS